MRNKLNAAIVLGIFIIGAWFSVDLGQVLVAENSMLARAESICLVAQCGYEGGQLWQRVDGSQSGGCNGFNYAPVTDIESAEFRSTDTGGIEVIDNCFLQGPSTYTYYPPTPPPQLSCTLNANPSSVQQGNPSTLTWFSTGATTCTGVNFSTGGATQNLAGVSTGPLNTTTTFTMNCSTAAPSGGTWQMVEEDYTDYFCLNPNGINDPNQNGLNQAYSFIPNCSNANPEGASCTTAGAK
ncbi:MAG: hypothetical protein AAB923_02340 [Patescibacteria group bacterium]